MGFGLLVDFNIVCNQPLSEHGILLCRTVAENLSQALSRRCS
jgi:hypothetical protein